MKLKICNMNLNILARYLPIVILCYSRVTSL
nr:MAG TPA: hypothetical protein [Caudoviricetes sp.]DAQ42261.1 MAG TPA: hypothetical protein [Caudoviricetes sp.]